MFISTHTPTQGVTVDHGLGVDSRVYFNSHPHAGGDLRCSGLHNIPKISTHTPTQGVTFAEMCLQDS